MLPVTVGRDVFIAPLAYANVAPEWGGARRDEDIAPYNNLACPLLYVLNTECGDSYQKPRSFFATAFGGQHRIAMPSASRIRGLATPRRHGLKDYRSPIQPQSWANAAASIVDVAAAVVHAATTKHARGVAAIVAGGAEPPPARPTVVR